MRALHMENSHHMSRKSRGMRLVARLGLRPPSTHAARTEDPFGDLSDPLVRELAPDPVSWWKRWGP